ncbi:MAG: type II secretion system inner membrane protein GspF [Planctomycetota bacterium]
MKFQSVYLAADGGTVKAVLEAQDPQELHERLHRNGCLLLKARVVPERADASWNVRLSTKRLVAFTQSLQGALGAGVPLLTVLEAMREQEEDPEIEAMIARLAERIGSGESLAEAMKGWPRAFPPVLRAMVHAGEQSGSLPSVLESVCSFLEWRLSVSGTIRQALIYPIVIAVAGYGLLLLLLGFVLPRLGGIISKMGAELPAASRVLVDLSGFVSNHVPAILGWTAALVAGMVLLIRSDAGKGALGAVLSRLPVAGRVVRMLATAQLCRSLGVLLRSGLTVPHALELSAESVSEAGTRKAVLRAREAILGGHKITDSLGRIGLFPPLALSMVRVGEDSGKLPETLEHLSGVYDRETKEAVKRGLSLLEPIFTVALGLIVGGVAVLVITTIYSSMRGLGR